MSIPSLGEFIILASIFLLFLYLVVRLPKNKKKLLSFWRRKKKLSHSDYEAFIFQLSYALRWMSDHNIGCLLVVEKKDNLQKYIVSGYQIEAKLTSEFLINIFANKNSALHDGGVIVRGFNIVSISSYFPVTQSQMTVEFGSRHRAAAGLTEITDSIAFVVSETSGKISISRKGKIESLDFKDVDNLADQLFTLFHFYIK